MNSPLRVSGYRKKEGSFIERSEHLTYGYDEFGNDAGKELNEAGIPNPYNSIYNWKRELLPGEVDLIENAKYYILDNQTMLCISQNDGGKVYVFTRSSY